MIEILVVEDERPISNLIKINLTKAGYACTCVYDGLAAVDALDKKPYDLVLLDIMLPGADGYEVMEYLAPLEVPVIFLTAKTTVSDRVRGLRMGADDYLTKPFEAEELLAVVKTLVRRQGELIPDVVTVGDLKLDRKNYILSGPEKQLQLGKKEYDIMRVLMANKGLVISKETLLLKVWGEGSEAVENNVETYISFLRKKLHFLKVHVWIVTIRGLGYRLTEREETA